MNLKELASFSDRLQCGVGHSVHSVRKMQDARYSTTLLPSVNTAAQGMFCGAKCQYNCTKNVLWCQVH